MKRASLLTFALLFTGQLVSAAEVRNPINASLPASGIRHVLVELPVSDVTFVNSTSGSIEVTGDVRREYDGSKDMVKAQKIVADAAIDIQPRGDRAVIRKKFGPAARSRSARGHNTAYHVQIAVPTGTSIEVRQRVGQVSVDGDFGDIDIDMRVGDVSIKVPRSSVREIIAKTRIGEVNTNLGDRIITREGVLPGTTHYLNEGGRSMLRVAVTVGEVNVELR